MLEINGTCLVFILSFLVFVYLLNKTLWKPVGQIKEIRNNDLLSEQDKASEAESKTQSIIKQVNSQVKEIKKSEHDYIEHLLKDFAKEKELDESKIKADMEEFKRNAYRQIVEEEQALKSSLEEEANKLAKLIISKIAGEVSLPERVTAQ